MNPPAISSSNSPLVFALCCFIRIFTYVFTYVHLTGIGVEGIGSIIAGAFGSLRGTISYEENVGAIGITKVGALLLLSLFVVEYVVVVVIVIIIIVVIIIVINNINIIIIITIII